jgi:hypothetical protein
MNAIGILLINLFCCCIAGLPTKESHYAYRLIKRRLTSSTRSK